MSDRGPAPTPAELTLSRLLEGVGAEEFLSTYWGKKPRVVRRNQPGFYGNLLTLADIDSLIYAGRFRPGEFRISRADEGIDLQFRDAEAPDEPPPSTTLYKAFDEGHSLVLHGLHLRWPAMAAATKNLERSLGCGVTTNVYLTPARSQAYPLHYDSHDFFIFQLHGSKHWRIFEESAKRKPIRELGPLMEEEAWAPGPLLQEFDLEDGDLLYVPRGFGHEVTSLDTSSLHLTVGLHGITWHQLLVNSLAKLAAESEELRSFVPLSPSASECGVFDLSGAGKVREILRNRLDLQAGIDVYGKQYRTRSEPVPDGHWLTLDRVRALDGGTVVGRRYGLTHAIEERGAMVELLFLQERVSRPAGERASLEFAASRERFAVSEIPGSTPEAQRELAGELVRKGFLTIHGPAGSKPAKSNESSQGARAMNDYSDKGETRVSLMNETPAEPKKDGEGKHSEGGCGCASCASASQSGMEYVYAIGRISARFPSIDIEKELQQVVRGTETAKLTDSQVLYQVLSQPDNAYIAREMCWVFSVRGIETFLVAPRSGLELNELVNALNLPAGSGATNVVIGSRLAGLPTASCAGLSLPGVLASKIYSFNLDEFVKSLPLAEPQIAAGKELLDRITHLIDNVGDLDEHRAVNYLALRYLAIYNLVIDNYNRDFSLQGLRVNRVATRSNRRLVDVTLKFISRKTDVRELYSVRVDVSGMYPFLVSPLHPVFEKDF